MITSSTWRKDSPNPLVKTHIANLHPSEDEKSTLGQHIASTQFQDCNHKGDSDKTMDEESCEP